MAITYAQRRSGFDRCLMTSGIKARGMPRQTAVGRQQTAGEKPAVRCLLSAVRHDWPIPCRAGPRLKIWPGTPYPLGATYDGAGTNFSLFSEAAERVELCLFDDDGKE